MTQYVQDKVIEALKKAKGMRGPAKRMLAGLCAADERFFRELVSNHLSAILDHAMQHYARAKLTQIGKKASIAASTTRKTPDGVGREMLRKFASQNTPVFGMDDPSQGTGKRPVASARHRDAITKIARKIPKRIEQEQ